MEPNIEEKDKVWKVFLRKHWKIAAIAISGVVAAAIVAVFVLLWFVVTAQVTGFVPAILGQWTIGNVWAFCWHLLWWEIVFVVSWAGPATIILVIFWYKKLSPEERKELEGDSKHGKSASEGGGVSFIVTVTWLIQMWLVGRWDLAFQAWTLNDWIYTWLTAFLWDLIIFGIPIALIALGYLYKEMQPAPQS
jgi:hypothetical protein